MHIWQGRVTEIPETQAARQRLNAAREPHPHPYPFSSAETVIAPSAGQPLLLSALHLGCRLPH